MNPLHEFLKVIEGQRFYLSKLANDTSPEGKKKYQAKVESLNRLIEAFNSIETRLEESETKQVELAKAIYYYELVKQVLEWQRKNNHHPNKIALVLDSNGQFITSYPTL